MQVKSRLAHPTHLDDFLLYRLSRLLSTAGTLVIRLCEGQHGITRREWRLLELLAHHDAVPPSRLAELAQLDRARTSRALGSLVKKKLVSRTTLSSDRRHAALHLTESGRRLYQTLLPQVRSLNLELLQDLSDAQVTLLDAVLDRLHLRAQRMVLSHDEIPKTQRRQGGRSRRMLD